MWWNILIGLSTIKKVVVLGRKYYQTRICQVGSIFYRLFWSISSLNFCFDACQISATQTNHHVNVSQYTNINCHIFINNSILYFQNSPPDLPHQKTFPVENPSEKGSFNASGIRVRNPLIRLYCKEQRGTSIISFNSGMRSVWKSSKYIPQSYLSKYHFQV